MAKKYGIDFSPIPYFFAIFFCHVFVQIFFHKNIDKFNNILKIFLKNIFIDTKNGQKTFSALWARCNGFFITMCFTYFYFFLKKTLVKKSTRKTFCQLFSRFSRFFQKIFSALWARCSGFFISIGLCKFIFFLKKHL